MKAEEIIFISLTFGVLIVFVLLINTKYMACLIEKSHKLFVQEAPSEREIIKYFNVRIVKGGLYTKTHYELRDKPLTDEEVDLFFQESNIK